MKTRLVKSKNITLGGGSPILVQTMLERPFYAYDDKYLEKLKYHGADIVRFSIDGTYDKDELKAFIKNSPIPLVIDIKADIKNALFALDSGIDVVRINPSLITSKDAEEIIKCTKDRGAIMRIGTNEGSTKGESAINLIQKTLEIAERVNFTNIVLSLKASDPESTLALNRELSSRFDFPIHIGLTEAGGSIQSAVRSTYVLSELLKDGIGDTIRYSMAADEINEVIAGVELLRVMGLREPYLNLIVCPSCSRATFLTGEFLPEVQDDLYRIAYNHKKPITIAIMGCPLNGIGEASSADVGISGSKDNVVIFKKGEIVLKEPSKRAKDALLEVVKSFY